ncbi:hypothetical protein RUM44_007884 [Polyplax serrata]|uniref:Cation efflux protein transmembrane domain-containing protein n=1 Tax=Polyplax serrata TaxID=468196 RepID=A0ABR1B7F2_POLSC
MKGRNRLKFLELTQENLLKDTNALRITESGQGQYDMCHYAMKENTAAAQKLLYSVGDYKEKTGNVIKEKYSDDKFKLKYLELTGIIDIAETYDTENKAMAFKEWFQKLRPMQLYIILVLTGVFFTVELIISHFTHSLTLLVDSYHMLCNMIALTGCIITIKSMNKNINQKLRRNTKSSSEWFLM